MFHSLTILTYTSGKLLNDSHSLLKYSSLPKTTIALSSSLLKQEALRGMMKFTRPIRGEDVSANKDTTTWLRMRFNFSRFR